MNVNKRSLKNGAYTTIISVVVVVILIIVNLLVSQITHTSDLTDMNTYSLSNESVHYLSTFDTDVTMYYVTESDSKSVMFSNLAELFARENSHIHLSYKDPVQYPQLIYKYNGVNEKINSNSIILVNEAAPERYIYIDYEDMCIYQTKLDSATMTTKKVLYGYDAELEIIKGLVQITGDSTGKVYFTTGHGEETTLLLNEGKISDSLSSLLGLNRLEVGYLSTQTLIEVPNDCSLLVLAGISKDLTEEEVSLIENYMAHGGNVCALLHYGTSTLPNLSKFLGQFGIELASGILCESDQTLTSNGNPSYVLSTSGSGYCFWPLGCALKLTGKQRNTVGVTMKVNASKGYVKGYDATELAFGDGDQIDAYGMMAVATETYHNITSKLYVINSYLFLSDKCINSNSAYKNSEVFLEVLSDGASALSSLSIPTKLDREPALTMNNSQKRNLSILFFGVIPGILLMVGIIVFIRRRQ